MTSARTHDRVLLFLSRHERPLASVLFVSGFITDLLTFGLLDIPAVTLLFAAYLVIAVVLTSVAHYTHGKAESGLMYGVSVLAPLFAQFVFGSLLSGFVIFYTRSAELSISWPFIILLLVVFFGNEVFRNYRSHLIFQTILLYFCLYSFVVFAIPVYVGKISTLLFLISTLVTIALFAFYLSILKWISWKRLKQSLKGIVVSVSAVTGVVVASYLTGVLPPIPLTLKAGGIYHAIEYSNGSYTAQGEDPQLWYDPRPEVVHHTSGTPLYAYSAVFAPGSFTTSIVHVWERYDETTKKWNIESTVAFPLSGGREGGYRGYSLKYDPQPGEWRVLVQTLNGQTIGDFRFTVENIAQKPELITETF
jgi:hypothetical protein